MDRDFNIPYYKINGNSEGIDKTLWNTLTATKCIFLIECKKHNQHTTYSSSNKTSSSKFKWIKIMQNRLYTRINILTTMELN